MMLMAAVLVMANAASAQGLQDILNGLRGSGSDNTENSSSAGGGSTLGNLLEGVFSSSNITVQDMMGVWTSNGPAVTFKSDNLLKKAGGVAAAAAVEKELSKYYQQYGLNGTTITINSDGTFQMKLGKLLTLKGNITPNTEGKGVFDFNFTALGSMKLGSVKTYVQKTSKSMDIMFDATKLKNLISTVANYTGIKLAKTIGSLLDSYEGLCVGFRMEKTGKVAGEDEYNSSNGGGLGGLINGVLGGGNSGSNTNNSGSNNSGSNNSNTNNSNTNNSGDNGNGVENAINGLLNVLGGKK